MEVRCKDCNELLCNIDDRQIDWISKEWYVEHQSRKDSNGEYVVNVILVGGHVECKNHVKED